MNTALLWFLVILGLLEVGGSISYLSVGKWPERTPTSIAFNLVFWLALAAWAGSLLWKA